MASIPRAYANNDYFEKTYKYDKLADIENQPNIITKNLERASRRINVLSGGSLNQAIAEGKIDLTTDNTTSMLIKDLTCEYAEFLIESNGAYQSGSGSTSIGENAWGESTDYDKNVVALETSIKEALATLGLKDAVIGGDSVVGFDEEGQEIGNDSPDRHFITKQQLITILYNYFQQGTRIELNPVSQNPVDGIIIDAINLTKYKGTYIDLATAKAAITNPFDGDYILIGKDSPYREFIYDGVSKDWIEAGTSQGIHARITNAKDRIQEFKATIPVNEPVTIPEGYEIDLSMKDEFKVYWHGLLLNRKGQTGLTDENADYEIVSETEIRILKELKVQTGETKIMTFEVWKEINTSKLNPALINDEGIIDDTGKTPRLTNIISNDGTSKAGQMAADNDADSFAGATAEKDDFKTFYGIAKGMGAAICEKNTDTGVTRTVKVFSEDITSSFATRVWTDADDDLKVKITSGGNTVHGRTIWKNNNIEVHFQEQFVNMVDKRMFTYEFNTAVATNKILLHTTRLNKGAMKETQEEITEFKLGGL